MNSAVPFDDSGSIEAVQSKVLDGRAVIVLGAGCQRIDFDSPDSAGWAEVLRRMRLLAQVAAKESDTAQAFLESFWLSRLSDERARALGDADSTDSQALGRQLTLRVDADSSLDALSALDEARTRWLALPILDLFALGTRRLGAVISQGATPVTNWTAVSDARNSNGLERAFGAPEDAPQPLGDELEDFARDLERNVKLLSEWLKDPRGTPVLMGARDLSLDIRAADAEPLRRFLTAASIDAVKRCAIGFGPLCVGTSVSEQPPEFTGASVEWLGDLLWHVLTCDVRVSPSQRELAFFVNLPYKSEQVTRSTFTRARPGEYRYGKRAVVDSPRDRQIRSMMRNRAHADQPDALQTPAGQRAVYKVLASLLVEQSVKRGAAKRSQRPLAIVTGYDLLFEDYLLRAIDPGSRRNNGEPNEFAVVVPVRLTSDAVPDTTVQDWVVVLIQRPLELTDTSLLTAPRTVGWLRDSNVQEDTPAVLRVSGAPFFPLLPTYGAGETQYLQSKLGLPPRPGDAPDRDWLIEPAVLFDDYEASLAVQSLSFDAMWFASTLQWNERSWLFLGEGFPEWVPRLRLLQTAMRQPGRARAPKTQLMAFDREFSWSDASLLDALGATRYQGDLRELKVLGTYASAEPRVREFWGAVAARAEREDIR